MKLASLLILSIFIVSCSSQKNSQSKINSVEVSEKLVQGKSTQKEILETFGSPDIVEKTPRGDMWGYTRHASEDSSFGGGISHYVNYLSWWNWTGASVNGSKSSSSTQTASLVLYFNQQKVLSNYTYRTERF